MNYGVEACCCIRDDIGDAIVEIQIEDQVFRRQTMLLAGAVSWLPAELGFPVGESNGLVPRTRLSASSFMAEPAKGSRRV
jgi:hypothetical protein